MWPLGLLEGTEHTYIYYVERYDFDDPECLNPSATYRMGADTEPWPFICPDCDIPLSASAASDFPGIPVKVPPGYTPDFEFMTAPYAKKLYDIYIEFTNPSTLRTARAQVSFFVIDPAAAKRPKGTVRVVAVGYEIDIGATTPSDVIVVRDKYVKRVGSSEHVVRALLGSVEAVILLAKP